MWLVHEPSNPQRPTPKIENVFNILLINIDGRESGNSRSRSREREFTGKYREREMPFPDLEIPVGKGNKFSVPGKTREFPNKIRR